MIGIWASLTANVVTVESFTIACMPLTQFGPVKRKASLSRIGSQIIYIELNV